EKFCMPHGRGDHALLAAALAVAKNAEPLVPVFVKHDMPPDFLDDLNRCIRNLQRAIAERDTAVQAHDASRANMKSALEKGLDAVHRLDAIVRNKLREDPVTLEVWTRANHIERGSRAKAVTPAPGPARAPAA